MNKADPIVCVLSLKQYFKYFCKLGGENIACICLYAIPLLNSRATVLLDKKWWQKHETEKPTSLKSLLSHSPPLAKHGACFTASGFSCAFIKVMLYKWLERWGKIYLEWPCRPNTSKWKIHWENQGQSCAMHFQGMKRHNYIPPPVGLWKWYFILVAPIATPWLYYTCLPLSTQTVTSRNKQACFVIGILFVASSTHACVEEMYNIGKKLCILP